RREGLAPLFSGHYVRLDELPPDFHLGAEGPLIVVATAEGFRGSVAIRYARGVARIAVVRVAPFLIPLRVGCEDADSRTGPDAVACLSLLCQGDFVLAVFVVSFLRFDVVVAHFQQGAHDRRPFEHWTNTHGPPLGTVVVVTIDVLVHTDVHQVPTVCKGDCTVIQHSPHSADDCDAASQWNIFS